MRKFPDHLGWGRRSNLSLTTHTIFLLQYIHCLESNIYVSLKVFKRYMKILAALFNIRIAPFVTKIHEEESQTNLAVSRAKMLFAQSINVIIDVKVHLNGHAFLFISIAASVLPFFQFLFRMSINAKIRVATFFSAKQTNRND